MTTTWALFSGCNASFPVAKSAAVPSDFALQVHINGQADSNEPHRLRSQYILEPNRQLRVALGVDATGNYFPKPARKLTFDEVQTLYRHIYHLHLMSQPERRGTSSHTTNRADNSIRYQIQITAHGRTHRYITTLHKSPVTLRLIRLLIRMRQPILPVPIQHPS
ncbi:MAG: hypothetical protein CMJ20_13405 [Phycisphaeraceae bacterium]|nr:hypothetical protein [Phycisphaeraceae bacterium]